MQALAAYVRTEQIITFQGDDEYGNQRTEIYNK